MMRKGFAFLFLALLIALPAFAQEVGSVSGTVSFANGDPASDAYVIIWDDDRNFFETRTDREGAFAFQRVPIGEWTIRVTMGIENIVEDQFEVAANENTVIDLVFEDGDDEFGSVSGSVFTVDGDTVVNASVVIFNEDRDIFRTQTDRNGEFSFERVPVGNYHIIASLEDVGTAEDDIEVIANEETVIDLVIDNGGGDEFGSVRGSVFTVDSVAVVNASVVIFNEDRDIFRTQTDRNGEFSFERVPVGNYHIIASLEGVGTVEDDFGVVANEETVIDLVIEDDGDEFGSVSGSVTTADGDSVANASVVIFNDDRDMFRTQTAVSYTHLRAHET